MSWGAKRRSPIDQFGVSAATAAYRLRSPHCPVTGGRATRLTVETYRKMCLARRAPDKWACVQCHGGQRPPAELELVAADQLNQPTTKENDMGVMYGKCEICGEQKKIRSVRDKKACATCEHIWRASNVQPELVLKTLASAKGGDYLRQAVGTEPVDQCEPSLDEKMVAQIRSAYNLDDQASVADFLQNINSERNEAIRRLHAAEQIIGDVRFVLGVGESGSIIHEVKRLQSDLAREVEKSQLQEKEIEELREKMKNTWAAATAVRDERDAVASELSDTVARLGAIRTALNAAPDDDLVLRAEAVNYSAELFYRVRNALGLDSQDGEDAPQLIALLLDNEKQLNDKIAQLETIVDGETFVPAVMGETGDRSTILLDLALDVIAGRVSGLDAERIAALR